MFLALLEEPRNLRDLADVGLDRHGLCAILEGLDLGNDFLGRCFRGLVVDDNRTTATAEFDGTATAYSTTGTGDDGDLVVQGRSGDENGSLGHGCGTGGC